MYVLLAAAPVPEDHGQVGRHDGQQHRERHDHRQGGAQHPRQADAEPPEVARAALGGEQGQHRGGQRHRDHRVRHHHDQERLRVDRVAGPVELRRRWRSAERLGGTTRGQVDHDGVRDLVDDHEQHGPDAQPQRVAQSGALEVEPRPVVEAGRSQERDEHQQLDGDAEGRAQAEQQPPGRGVRRARRRRPRGRSRRGSRPGSRSRRGCWRSGPTSSARSGAAR